MEFPSSALLLVPLPQQVSSLLLRHQQRVPHGPLTGCETLVPLLMLPPEEPSPRILTWPLEHKAKHPVTLNLESTVGNALSESTVPP